MTARPSRAPRRALIALTGAAALTLSLTAAPALAAPVAAPVGAAPASAASAPLTNLAHLDFLLDEATPPADVPGHSTYRQAEEPTLVLPWTYADARDGGTFERIGGGTLDPATGDWTQGAYNADDVTRAAIVYLRDWQLTGSDDSRQKAYELLRATAYLQTTDGPDAGNVVLWMQPDGTLNPSAEPVELPDPSDSGESYWLARTIWALGEGYAAFQDADPEFAAFLDERLSLAIDAVDRQVLVRYGQWAEADGLRVPAWLIVDGADASAEAVLGLAARVEAGSAPAAEDALRKLAEGIAAMGAGDAQSWPYGAILPWAQSRSMWHAWASQMPAALAEASVVLGEPALLEPARADGAVFTPTLLTSGGPDNAWFPAPTEQVQIAYGADSRVQSLLALADATGSDGFADLAGMQAAWFFGANRSGAVMYDPATGVTYDGLQEDGTVNRNSGAESTIHGLLTAIALDARPEVRDLATGFTEVADQQGLTVVEAESASGHGTVVEPESWTGESSWSGGALVLEQGDRATFDIGTDDVRRTVEPVLFLEEGERSLSTWSPGGALRPEGPAQGISPSPGVLLPQSLTATAAGSRSTLTATVRQGTVTLDALLVLPTETRLALAGSGGEVTLVHAASTSSQPVRLGAGSVTVYDGRGEQVRAASLDRERTVVIPAGGFAVHRG